MGSMKKKEPGIVPLDGGRWRVRARIRIDGKNVQRQIIVTGTREQARAKHAELKTEIRTMAPDCSLKADPQIRTFENAVNIYLVKKNVSISHKRKIEYLKANLGAVPLETFPDRFEKWLSLYRITPNKRTMKTPGNHAVNRFVEIGRAVFNLLRDLKLITGENPISKAKFPRLKEIPRDVILTDEQQKHLLNVVDTEAPHLSAIVRFALAVPCRRSELINMKRGDLDLFGNCIRVRNGTTKNDAGTWKPIPPDQVEYFRTLPDETEYLFFRPVQFGKETRYMPLGDFKRAWGRCLKLVGLKGSFRFHDTRHISGSALIDNGTPEQVVMTVAGWKTNMLKTYYNRQPKKALELVRFYPIAQTRCANIAGENG
jgi:integrase